MTMEKKTGGGGGKRRGYKWEEKIGSIEVKSRSVLEYHVTLMILLLVV